MEDSEIKPDDHDAVSVVTDTTQNSDLTATPLLQTNLQRYLATSQDIPSSQDNGCSSSPVLPYLMPSQRTEMTSGGQHSTLVSAASNDKPVTSGASNEGEPCIDTGGAHLNPTVTGWPNSERGPCATYTDCANDDDVDLENESQISEILIPLKPTAKTNTSGSLHLATKKQTEEPVEEASQSLLPQVPTTFYSHLPTKKSVSFNMQANTISQTFISSDSAARNFYSSHTGSSSTKPSSSASSNNYTADIASDNSKMNNSKTGLTVTAPKFSVRNKKSVKRYDDYYIDGPGVRERLPWKAIENSGPNKRHNVTNVDDKAYKRQNFRPSPSWKVGQGQTMCEPQVEDVPRRRSVLEAVAELKASSTAEDLPLGQGQSKWQGQREGQGQSEGTSSTDRLQERLNRLVASLDQLPHRQMLVIEATIVQCISSLQDSLYGKLKKQGYSQQNTGLINRLLRTVHTSLSRIQELHKQEKEALNQSEMTSSQLTQSTARSRSSGKVKGQGDSEDFGERQKQVYRLLKRQTQLLGLLKQSKSAMNQAAGQTANTCKNKDDNIRASRDRSLERNTNSNDGKDKVPEPMKAVDMTESIPDKTKKVIEIKQNVEANKQSSPEANRAELETDNVESEIDKEPGSDLPILILIAQQSQEVTTIPDTQECIANTQGDLIEMERDDGNMQEDVIDTSVVSKGRFFNIQGDSIEIERDDCNMQEDVIETPAVSERKVSGMGAEAGNIETREDVIETSVVSKSKVNDVEAGIGGKETGMPDNGIVEIDGFEIIELVNEEGKWMKFDSSKPIADVANEIKVAKDSDNRASDQCSIEVDDVDIGTVDESHFYDIDETHEEVTASSDSRFCKKVDDAGGSSDGKNCDKSGNRDILPSIQETTTQSKDRFQTSNKSENMNKSDAMEKVSNDKLKPAEMALLKMLQEDENSVKQSKVSSTKDIPKQGENLNTNTGNNKDHQEVVEGSTNYQCNVLKIIDAISEPSLKDEILYTATKLDTNLVNPKARDENHKERNGGIEMPRKFSKSETDLSVSPPSKKLKVGSYEDLVGAASTSEKKYAKVDSHEFMAPLDAKACEDHSNKTHKSMLLGHSTKTDVSKIFEYPAKKPATGQFTPPPMKRYKEDDAKSESELMSPTHSRACGDSLYNVSPTATSMSSDIFVVKAKELDRRMKQRTQEMFSHRSDMGLDRERNRGDASIGIEMDRERHRHSRTDVEMDRGRTREMGRKQSDNQSNLVEENRGIIMDRSHRNPRNVGEADKQRYQYQRFEKKDTISDAIDSVIKKARDMNEEGGEDNETVITSEARNANAASEKQKKEPSTTSTLFTIKEIPSSTTLVSLLRPQPVTVHPVSVATNQQLRPSLPVKGQSIPIATNQQLRPSLSVNNHPISMATNQQLRPSLPVSNQPVPIATSSSLIPVLPATLPSLKELMKSGRISPGKNVLSVSIQGVTHTASVITPGKIQTTDAQIYTTVAQWLSTLLHGEAVKKRKAYQLVCYRGVPIISLCDLATNTYQGPAKHDIVSHDLTNQMPTQPTLPGVMFKSEKWLNQRLSSCLIRLLKESDFISNEDLPTGFWTEDYSKVTLTKDIWNSVDAW